MISSKKLKRCVNYFLPSNLMAKIRFRIIKFAKINTLFFRQTKIKLNIGSAGINNDLEWYPTDKENLDITKEEDWQKILSSLRIDNIVAEHVWEHLTQKETELANINCFRYLKKGGILRIAVPDGYNQKKEYIDAVKPGGIGRGASGHRILYNYRTISDYLQRAGFKTELLEYWDELGQFHYKDWGKENGFIIRSKRYDPRNKGSSLEYTSLIIDAIKP